MSNIIDGIDYGMGYEPTTEWGLNIQWWSDTINEWIPSSSLCQTHVDSEIRYGGHYRRPLPIISQHPGAIPLEPGEMIRLRDDCLMRNGEVSERFEPGRGWDAYGRHAVYTEKDLIARLPKVEQKEPEKAKEERVEEVLIEVNRARIHVAYEMTTQITKIEIRLSEAARIAQLPEVIAEVERQRKEKEIKVGDWFWTKLGTPDRAQAFGNERFEVLGKSNNWHKVQDCTKIHDPAFVAMLEKGSQP